MSAYTRDDVKPCPFCGATPDIDDPNTFRASQGDKWGAMVCCCEGPEVRTGYGPLAGVARRRYP